MKGVYTGIDYGMGNGKEALVYSQQLLIEVETARMM